MEHEHGGDLESDVRDLRVCMAEVRADVRHLKADVGEVKLDIRRLDDRLFQLMLLQIATLLAALGSVATAIVTAILVN